MNTPQISVLMAVHNGEKFIAQSIKSIINQTFTGFEFIIIDDASTDNTLEIIKSYNDSRIKIYRNDTNIGLTKSLNKGLDYCTGKYIARMDDDDISKPERLLLQYETMETDTGIAVCGSRVDIIDENGNIIGEWQTPLSYPEIKARLFFFNSVAHPTAMVRAEILKKFRYKEHFKYSQDYMLWSEIAKNQKIVNLKQKLLLYRRHKSQITHKQQNSQDEFAKKVNHYHLSKLLGKVNELQTDLFYNLIKYNKLPATKNEMFILLDLLYDIYIKNVRKNIYPPAYFNPILKKYWQKCFDFEKSYTLGIKTLKYINFPLNSNKTLRAKAGFTRRVLGIL